MSNGLSPARIRASDSDRERVAAALRAAVEDGRLDPAEFEERADRVYRARTLGELPPVLTDLLAPDQQPIRVDETPLAALFSPLRRSGRWVVRPRESALAVGATLELDLSDALLMRERVELTAVSVFGRIEVTVPEGVRVHIRGRSLLARRSSAVRAPRGGDAPVLEVSGLSLLGSVRIRTARRRGRLRRGRGRRTALE
ncbi:DUF1707 SHOCT-like domain-containing protein [Streptomonospora litoralis]|uniref:DUF1707 domain-containing protein n=1 Tax=Streptomonospora litoralis TaxID=2498135 RepID=A0A4P6PWG3_9ACTN|nr:DUF1707 domain-containing protein [Streptomonospora litoralis]QBI52508.1 hypothetical protein EKD16_03485 [Streptomonospora litoralis]